MSKKLSLKTRKYIRELINNESIEGGNITSQIKSLTKTINKNIAKPISKISDKAMDYGNAILHGRNDYPPKVRDLLRTTQHIFIKSITIKKSPVPALITGALSVFTLGKFGKRVERSFDELFHLYLDITLENDERYLLEKNEVINMEKNPTNRNNTESKQVSQLPHISINDLLANAKRSIGPAKFYGYSAYNNNCQDFIVNLFKHSNIGNEEDIKFIKQDTKQLFTNMPALRKFSNIVTDLGASVNVITTGKGVTEIHNYSDILKHLTEHIMDAKEPIDNRDYKQAIKMIKSIKAEKLKGGKLVIHHYHHIIDGTGQHQMLSGEDSNDSEAKTLSDSESEEENRFNFKSKYYFT
jgi:hypothetical protein